MKVYVDADEWYPVYSPSETSLGLCDEIEVDEATYKRWVEAHDAFIAAQDEIEQACKQARAGLLASTGAAKHGAESRTGE